MKQATQKTIEQIVDKYKGLTVEELNTMIFESDESIVKQNHDSIYITEINYSKPCMQTRIDLNKNTHETYVYTDGLAAQLTRAK